LHDFEGKLLAIYTFGGQLDIETGDAHTTCRVTSSAPIIPLQTGQDIQTQLVAEFEALLVRLRANWQGSDEAFERRLTKIEPFTCFVAGLVAIKQGLESLPANMRRRDPYRSVAPIVNDEI
jgi:hypothetical protein